MSRRGAPEPTALPGATRSYEVWRVEGALRTKERSFPELWLALRYVAVQESGAFDIRMPDGAWFTERRTERLPTVRGDHDPTQK